MLNIMEGWSGQRFLTASLIFFTIFATEVFAQNATADYTYDELGRLITVAYPETMATYTYDDVGNRTSYSVTGTGQPFVKIGNTNVFEGGNLWFTVWLTEPSLETITVDYATSLGTAQDGDFVAVTSGTVTFLPGETTQTLKIQTVEDLDDEPEETVLVTLSNPVGVLIDVNKSVGTGRIKNDDGSDVTFSVNNPSITEGSNLSARIVVVGNVDRDFEVTYMTRDGSALAGLDYQPQTGTVSFGPDDNYSGGELSKNILIPTVNGPNYEGNEYFYIDLSGPTNGSSILDGEGLATITDENDMPVIHLSKTSVWEGGNLTYTAWVEEQFEQNITVDWATTSEGSATAGAGDDFNAAAGTITFYPGDTEIKFSVNTHQDSVEEGDETVFVQLSNPTNAALDPLKYNRAGLIKDDDMAVATFSINNVGMDEGSSTSFKLIKQGTLAAPVTIHYESVDGTATAGEDYEFVQGSHVFDAGSGRVIKSVPVTSTSFDDRLFEERETFNVRIWTGDINNRPNNCASTDVTFQDCLGSAGINDDPSDRPVASISDATVSEGGELVFTVTLSNKAVETMYVVYGTSLRGTASIDDFEPKVGNVKFLAGETVKTITIKTVEDVLVESAETVIVTLSAGKGTLADPVNYQGTGTIMDASSGTGGRFRASRVSTAEGEPALFIIERSLAPAVVHSLAVDTVDETAVAGADYTGVTGVVTFEVGETEQAFAVQTTQETEHENDETFALQLYEPSGASVIEDDGQGTIRDDDDGASFTVDDVTVTEGGVLQFTVTKEGLTPASHDVSYFASEDTATVAGDYTDVFGTLSFLPNETEQTVSIATATDSLYEGDETVYLDLATPTNGAVIRTGRGTGTITDTNTPPAFSVADTIALEGADLVFTITKIGESVLEHSIVYGAATKTAISGTDFDAATGTLVFSPGETVKTVTVSGGDDNIEEGDETLAFTIASPSNGATIADGTAVGTIVDNEVPGQQLGPDDDNTTVYTFEAGQSYEIELAGGKGGDGSGGGVGGPGGRSVFTLTPTKDVYFRFRIGAEGLSQVGSSETPNDVTAGSGSGGGQHTGQGGGATSLIISEDGQSWTVAAIVGGGGGSAQANNGGAGGYVDGNGVDGVGNTGNGATTSMAGMSSSGTGDGAGPRLNGADGGYGIGGLGDSLFGIGGGGAGELAAATHSRDGGGGGSGRYGGAGGKTGRSAAAEGGGGGGSGYWDVAAWQSIAGIEPTITVNAQDSISGDGTASIKSEIELVPAFSVTDVTRDEGNDLVFTVTLSIPSTENHDVSFATVDDTAVAGTDYTAVSGFLTFAPGETSKTVSVTTLDNSNPDGSRQLFIDLSGPTNAALIADGQGAGTITDDEGPAPSFSIDDVSLDEGTDFIFTVTKTGTSAISHDVSYATADATALSGSDYVAVAGTLTFAAGEVSKTVTITTIDNGVEDGPRGFSVDLTATTNWATLSDAQAIGTITDDDVPAVPALPLGTVTLGPNDSSATVYRAQAGLHYQIKVEGAGGGLGAGGFWEGKGGRGVFEFTATQDVYFKFRVGRKGVAAIYTDPLADATAGGAGGSSGGSGQGGGATSVLVSSDQITWVPVAIVGGGGGGGAGKSYDGGGGGGLDQGGVAGEGSKGGGGATTTSAGIGAGGYGGDGGAPGQPGTSTGRDNSGTPGAGDPTFGIGGGGAGHGIGSGAGGGGSGRYGGGGGNGSGTNGSGGGGSGYWDAAGWQAAAGLTPTITTNQRDSNSSDGYVTITTTSP